MISISANLHTYHPAFYSTLNQGDTYYTSWLLAIAYECRFSKLIELYDSRFLVEAALHVLLYTKPADGLEDLRDEENNNKFIFY